MMDRIMKKRQFAVAGLMLMAVAMTMTSCVGFWEKQNLFEGNHISETRHLKDFEEIEINGSPTVYYTQSDKFSIKVKGPENWVKNIITEKIGNTLVIRNKGKIGVINVHFGEEDELAVYVTSPDLVGVQLNGSGDFISKGQIDTDEMKIALKGSGDIDIQDLICDRCDVQLIGSGDVGVDRLETNEVNARLIGSGDISMNLWKVRDTHLALRGSGDIDVDFKQDCKSVDCELNGSGDICLKGKIEHFSKQKHGSGDVDIANFTIEK